MKDCKFKILAILYNCGNHNYNIYVAENGYDKLITKKYNHPHYKYVTGVVIKLFIIFICCVF